MKEVKKESPFRGKDHQSVLMLLEEAQEKFGGVTEEFVAELSQSLNVPMSEIYGVATFYSFLSTKLLGKNVIRVCKSLPCFLKNSQMIIKSVEQETGIKPGETTPDGKFSLQLTNCIGLCDEAPAMMINDEVYGNLTPEKIAQILKTYKRRTIRCQRSGLY